jgi:hypothetical protein
MYGQDAVSLRSRGGAGPATGGGTTASYAAAPQQIGGAQQQQPGSYQMPGMPNQSIAQPNYSSPAHSSPAQQQQQQFGQFQPMGGQAPAANFGASGLQQNQSIAAATGFYNPPPSSGSGVNLSFPSYAAPAMPSLQGPSGAAAAAAGYSAPHPQSHSQHAIFHPSGSGGDLGVSFGNGGSGGGDESTPRDDGYGVGGLSMRGASPPMPGQAYNRGSPSNAMHRSGSMESALGGAASGSDDRLRRKQNTESLQHYTLFMYGMCGLAAFVMVVAWLTLGSASTYVALVLSICIFSFIFTLKLTEWIFSKDDANSAMRIISEAIREGSEGFLKVQYTAIATIAAIIAVVIGVIYLFREAPSKEISQVTLAMITSVSYLIGAFCSGLAGYIGVWVSIRVNIRVAVAASKFSFKDALLLSFRGGAVSACLSASLCILGVTVLYVFCSVFFVYFGNLPARHVPLLLVGYGFGGALVALFMQLGGGQ